MKVFALNAKWKLLLAALVLCLAVANVSQAETRVTYKSAKSTSSYYQMAVQIAEAMKAGSGGDIIVTVEESQGSVQNVKEVGHRSGNYVFTTPPGLVKLAMADKKMFEDASPRYQDIRGLFIIPSLTMHFVVRSDAGIERLADLAGHKYLIGKGSFGAREAAKYFELFGLKDAIELVDVELNAAVPALQNGQIDGFATSGSFPAPNVIEAAAGVDIDVLSLTEEQVEKTGRTPIVIPAGTYSGVDHDVLTTSLVVAAYATTDMDDETAYQLTKTFWEQKKAMGKANAWWKAVSPDDLPMIGAKLHPGALKYYEEAGVSIPEDLK